MQPTFSEGPPVPMMVEGVVDAKTLRQLAKDLGQAVAILELKEKGMTTAFSTASNQPFTVMIENLISHKLTAMQVRYRYDGFEWTDTIFAMKAGGFKIVRCRHDAS